ncbi:GAF and ANTAR domain-containing protein [Pseudonocardia endophytica]|uniref:ANTAR domain-containing protein n=1 Tax=Pseudonocardia endophytica TaxID=401976 RepID=A0A4R1HVD9_PSEEN|nr:GAF and ANTAR domain-containing protein [Pseudonocardia endophytica]TCK26704.1 ANTAR domain-containing protein [Pseudonocardia endophytica]
MASEQLDRLEEALARSASEVARPADRPAGPGVEERLAELTRAAVDNVPAADAVVLTMRSPDGGLDTYAPTGPDVVELDRLQALLREGPCLDAVAGGATTVIEVADFAQARERWPRFATTAAEQGITSLLTFAVAPDGAIPSAVTYYSRSPAGFDELSRSVATAFAGQIATALYGAERIADSDRTAALRDVLGEAKGILMERHRTDGEQAFEILLRAARTSNLMLVDVALWLVVGGGRQAAP